ncbi:MAG: aminotransferase class I/II-fold pyridoxal phosphate-dependent enzyme [Bacilli bacterium]
MQALILAAGLGSRMKEYTKTSTKSMVEINGKSLIERLLRQIDLHDFSKIVIVDGYKSEIMQDYVKKLDVQTPVEFITNKDYNITNNIYSVYLAKDKLIEEDTVMFESDLIFADEVLKEVLESNYRNLAVVSKFESWMDGTVVKIDRDSNITDFISKDRFNFKEIDSYFKTVNIYKFSKEFSKKTYFPFLEAQMQAFGKNEYYETILKTITQLDPTIVRALDIKEIPWYEVDDLQDLDVASSLFNTTPEKKYKSLHSRYGGFWRYPKLIDFCYLVNPFYPPQRMLDEMQSNIKRLVIDYPSGLSVNSSLVGKYYNIPTEYTVVGNGAAELIKSFMEFEKGKFGIIAPTFEEYPNRLDKDKIVKYYPTKKNFEYTVDDIINFYEENKVENLVLINPDNPTGNYIEKNEVIRLLKWCTENEMKLILDESFGDFVNIEEDSSLIQREIIEKFNNLILIKSISKSFGVPGVRLGFLMSSDKKLIDEIKKDVSIWNINSFGEFFLQIFEKYKKDYETGLKLFYNVRNDYFESLSNISYLEVLPSQANYFTCKILPEGNLTSEELAIKLLDNDKLLIKDLSSKDGFSGGNYIRLAVKKNEENDIMVAKLSEYLGG